MREADRQVFGIYPEYYNSEKLLYDFNLEEGDSFTTFDGIETTVSDIEYKEFSDGRLHKVITFAATHDKAFADGIGLIGGSLAFCHLLYPFLDELAYNAAISTTLAYTASLPLQPDMKGYEYVAEKDGPASGMSQTVPDFPASAASRTKSREDEYTPMVREGIEWGYRIVNPVYYGKDTFYFLQLKGDTTINGTIYKKCYRYRPFDFDTHRELAGCIRESNRQVHAVTPRTGDKEMQLFDFNLNVGDKFTIPELTEDFTVTNTGQVIMANGQLRKAFYVDNQTEPYAVEGIGYVGHKRQQPDCNFLYPTREPVNDAAHDTHSYLDMVIPVPFDSEPSSHEYHSFEGLEPSEVKTATTDSRTFICHVQDNALSVFANSMQHDGKVTVADPAGRNIYRNPVMRNMATFTENHHHRLTHISPPHTPGRKPRQKNGFRPVFRPVTVKSSH